MIGSSFLRGGRFITARSTGSTPRDCEGGPATHVNLNHYTRAELTVHENIDKQNLHRVERIAHSEHCAERDERERGDGRAQLERQKDLNIIEYMIPCISVSTQTRGSLVPAPSSTADKIVAKFSSTRITSVASCATSVPLLPNDTPICAILSAGASLTRLESAHR
jgi:hypothetical protein